jgi:hypothetical protein
MSQEERDWLDWLKRVRDGVITQRRAAEKVRGALPRTPARGTPQGTPPWSEPQK